MKNIKSSSELISKTDEYLAAEAGITSDVAKVEKRIEALSEIKDMMHIFGFNATFPEMLMMTRNKDEELQSDLSKQLKEIRETANLKKYMYNMVRVALAANRILLNMLRRGKIYDVASHFPYDGAYLRKIIYLGEPAVNAYNHLLKIETKRPQQEGYIATIVHDGKTVNLNINSDKGIDEKIKKSYGDNAYLVGVKRLVSPPLVRFKSIRIVVASSYAVQAAESLYPSLESESRIHSKEHEKYAIELSKFGISGDARIDLMEGHEDLKDTLYSKGLMSYENENLTLVPEVVSSIYKKKSKYSSAVVRHAEKQFAFDAFHFFITEPRRVRSSLPLYPGISVTVDPEIFDFLNYSGVDGALGLAQEKIKLETFSKVGRALGPAIIHLAGKPASWCAKEFGVDEDEIKKAAEQVSAYRGSISDQAQKFIEGLNPAKKE